MISSFNTIFIPATPRPYEVIQKSKISISQVNHYNSRQFLLGYFPTLSTVKMTEFAVNIVCFLWSSPDTILYGQVLMPLHSTLNLKDVLLRILLNLELPTIIIILALKYLHRLRISSNTLALDPGNLTELFVTCLLLAAKYHLDDNIRNSEWADKVGIGAIKLSKIERRLLGQFRYELGLSQEDFLSWIQWLSYSWNELMIERRDSNAYLERFKTSVFQITQQLDLV